MSGRVTFHCSTCGKSEVIAIAPGHEPRTVLDLFTLEVGEPTRVWCRECWLRQHRAEATQ